MTPMPEYPAPIKLQIPKIIITRGPPSHAALDKVLEQIRKTREIIAESDARLKDKKVVENDRR